MKQQFVNSVVNAVLYDGHILYPYRLTAKKNRQHLTFGRVCPELCSLAENGAEPCSMQTECLVEGGDAATLEITARFLHPMERDIGALAAPLNRMPAPDNPDFFHVVPELEVDGRVYLAWQEMVDRPVRLPAIMLKELREKTRALPFSFPASRAIEPILDRGGRISGVVLRKQETITGVVELSGWRIDDKVTKVTVRVINRTPVPSEVLDDNDEIVMRTFASTHTILHAVGATFLSLIDPPEKYADAAAGCRNLGAWPVLVGDEKEDERDTMIASPIILHDFPNIAPESANRGEQLTPRILAISEAEQREMHTTAAKARRMPRREPSTSATTASRKPRVETVSIQGIVHKTGDLVRVRPKQQTDALDLALAGRIAMIESIEQDASDKPQLALVLEDEAGRKLGRAQRSSHRLVYSTDEVEPLEGE